MAENTARAYPEPRPSKHLSELDSLRGLAALSVVLSHFEWLWRDLAMQDSSPLSRRVVDYAAYPFTAGHEAVVFFFILSGLVLSIPAVESRAQGYGVFVLRRICRIYLPYLAALALAVWGANAFHTPIAQGDLLKYTWSVPVDWHLVRQHLALIGDYDFNAFNPPIWSLIYEMRISLVFPVLAALVLKLKPVRSLVLALSVSAISLLLVNTLVWHPLVCDCFWTLHYASIFIIGIDLAAHREAISRIYIRRTRRSKLAIGAASAALYVYAGVITTDISGLITQYDMSIVADWLTAAGAAGLIVVSLNSASCQRALQWPPLHALGKMSYSVYLLHMIVILVLLHLLYGKLPLLSIFAFCFVLVLAGSWIFHRAIEVPSTNLGHWLSCYSMRFAWHSKKADAPQKHQ
jgi:peptidoglycan/LPS O-acetylase OafA/YrhL